MKLAIHVGTPGSRKIKKIKKPRTIADSTQVSSPIRDGRKRRGVAAAFNEDENFEGDDDENMANGFIVPDDEDDYGYTSRFSSPIEYDGDFGSIRRGSTHVAPKNSRRQGLGPRITSDPRLVGFLPEHLIVMEHFVNEAKKKEESIRNSKSLRFGLFTEQNLQDMVLNWTFGVDEMKLIKSIDEDKVTRYGKQFIPLLEEAWAEFEVLTCGTGDQEEIQDQSKTTKRLHKHARRAEELDMDQNHQTVLDLCTDSEDERAGANASDMEDDMSDAETSPFFPQERVQAFNDEVSQAQENAAASVPKPKPAATEKGGKGNWKKNSGRGRGKRQSGGRRTSGGKSSGGGGASSAGVKKVYAKKGSTSGTSRGGGSTRGSSSRPSNSRAAGSRGGADIRTYGRGGGIGAMPT